MFRSTLPGTVGIAVLALCQSVQAQPAAGRTYFQNNCAICHTVSADMAGAQGPGLFNVLGRPIAGAPGYNYSAALAKRGAGGAAWTAASLDQFLKDPAAFAPGTAMAPNVPKKQDRNAVIAYLATQKGPAVAPAAGAPAARPAASAQAATPARNLHWSNDAPGRLHETRAAALPAPYATSSATNSPRTVPRASGVLPAVPDNFKVSLWASDPDRGRLMIKAPNGDMFMSLPGKNQIKVFRSKTGEKADSINVFASGLNRPFGFAFWPVGPNPQYLYVANVNSIVRIPYKNGDLEASAKPEVVVPFLTEAPGGHTTRTLVFSADSKTMYLSIGSASNVAEGVSKQPPEPLAQWESKHGMGAIWGDELDRAIVLAYDADGKNKRTFATGLRNCVGLYLYQPTSELFCSVNERDRLGDNLPPDYLTRVKKGAFYGWPWYYIGANEDPRLAGVRPDLKGKVTVPDLLLTAHSAPLGMVAYQAPAGARAAFPAEYDGDIFLTLHGSWNRATRSGSKVVRVPMKNGVPAGQFQDFMTGFVVSDSEVWGRPSAVAVQNDGSLLVVDDLTGEIWRVAPK